MALTHRANRQAAAGAQKSRQPRTSSARSTESKPRHQMQRLTTLLPACLILPPRSGRPDTGTAGLTGQYFNNKDLSGSPVATESIRTEFREFQRGQRPVSNPSSFSGIWTGKVQPTVTGDQVFEVFRAVGSRGNVRLYVKNQLIIDDFSPAATPDTPISAAPPINPISGEDLSASGSGV